MGAVLRLAQRTLCHRYHNVPLADVPSQQLLEQLKAQRIMNDIMSLGYTQSHTRHLTWTCVESADHTAKATVMVAPERGGSTWLMFMGPVRGRRMGTRISTPHGSVVAKNLKTSRWLDISHSPHAVHLYIIQ